MPPPLPAAFSVVVSGAVARARFPTTTALLQIFVLSAASASASTTAAGGTRGMEEGSGGKKASPPAPEPEPAGGGVSQRIMPHLLNIYGSCATARDFEIYAAHATFEDPLMRAHGVKQIKSAFYTLPKVFGESKIVEYTVRETETGPGKSEILIDNKQHYKLLGRAVDLSSLITLNVEDGKIVKHEDWWEKKPLKTRETVSFPVVGWLAETSRRGAMLLTHALMACGKDPPSSSSSSN